jgi:hypothetical protein
MNANNDVVNKAIRVINDALGSDNKITTKGGVNSKKIVINDCAFSLLIEDEVTSQRLGMVLKRVKDTQAESNEPIIVVSKYIPALVAFELKQKGVNYLDVSGNAYVKQKNLLVYIKGEKLVKLPKVNQTRAFQEAGLKLIFVLLNDPKAVNKTYREIALLANISLASVGYVMKELEEANVILSTHQKRVLKNTSALLNRWIVAYNDVLRPRLLKMRMRFSKSSNNNYWNTLPINKLPGVTLWGGEPAAAILTQQLKPAKYTIYTKEEWQNIAKEFNLIPDENGEIEVLSIFWDVNLFDRHKNTVPSLLVYTDLINSGLERNMETAKIILDNELKNIK